LFGQEKYKVGAYSKGMQQRIGLACALLPDPELLFLDEPTSALDPIGRKEVRDIITALQKEGTTVFLNSHLLSEVEAVSDYIAIIDKGIVVKSGAMNELLMTKIKLKVECGNISGELFGSFKERFDSELLPQTEDGFLHFTLKNKDNIQEIASILISNGVKLYELTPQHETLENVFLDVVGEGKSK